MWGEAIYFAKNAKYSHDYRFNLPNGQFQFFLAEVLLGDYVVLASKTDLKMPPMNQ